MRGGRRPRLGRTPPPGARIEVRNETGGIDPRWWPELLGAAGLALGVLLLVVAILRPPFNRDDLEAATRQGWLRVGIAVGLSIAFVLLWPVIGFLVATPVFLVVATYVFGGRGWKTLVLFPVLMTAGIYLLFHTLLKVPL
ncbi:tripartite tricarboxylate transporter TctB family protein [Georgenia sp. SUBG003]|uniref:tripartite tricarboxylate transporter TctB family protein n=1 Tax=Georgenia sp. SUBG003 TaxID=1497974 RepID=UPI00069350BE